MGLASGEPRRGGTPLALMMGLGLVVIGITLLTHWPVLSARALYFDDDQYLTENPLVQHPGWDSSTRFLREVLAPSTVQGYYQPLAMISLMLDHAIAGRSDDLRVYHRTSLALHLANTVLLVVLLYLLFGQPWVAAMAGLLFGVHPMTVESIAWIGERKTLLAALFALWCLIVYVRYARRPGWKLYLLILATYILALLSKPTSTPLPAVMLLMDFWPLRRLNRKAWLEKVPLLAVGIVSSVITVLSQAGSARLDIAGRHSAWCIPLILAHNFVLYLYHVIWPVRLAPYYPFPQPLSLGDPMVLAGVIGTSILLAAAVVSLRWTRAFLTGGLIFLVALLPTMGIIGFTMVIASDRFVYLPAVGLLLVSARIMAWWWLRGEGKAGVPMRRVRLAAGVLLAAGFLAVGSRYQLSHWQTSLGLYDYALALAPKAAPLYNNRGTVRSSAGDLTGATQDYNKALELLPGYLDAHFNRGACRGRSGDFTGAMQDYSAVIALKPQYVEAYLNRGELYRQAGDWTRAIQDCTAAIDLNPDFADAYNNRAYNYSMIGEQQAAMQDCARAIALRPDCARYFQTRAMVNIARRDWTGAVQDYSRGIELQANDASAYFNRGRCFHAMGDPARAIQDYSQAIERIPDEPALYNDRGIAYAQLGDSARAIQDWTRAIALRPDYAEAYNNRAAAHGDLKQYERAWADVRRCRELGGMPSPILIQRLQAATRPTE